MTEKSEYSKDALLKGLRKLHTQTVIDGNEVKIVFGMDRYVIVNTITWTIVEWVDVQEWAQTVSGIFRQMYRKLEEE